MWRFNDVSDTAARFFRPFWNLEQKKVYEHLKRPVEKERERVGNA